MHRGGNQEADPPAGPSVISQSTTVRLDPTTNGSVSLAIEFTFPDVVTEFTVTVPSRLSCFATHGFRCDGDQCVWDGQTQRAHLKGTLQITDGGPGTYKYVDAGDWSIIRRPPLSVSYQCLETNPGLDRQYEVDGEGVASSDGCVIYLGPYNEHVRVGDHQLIRLAVPKVATLRESPVEILEALTTAANTLEVGGRTQTVLAIAAPSGVGWGSLGVQSGANGFWAQDTCRLSDVNNTWLHEYVHTRQEWETSASAKWLHEGIAEYYAALLTYRQGFAPFTAFYRFVSTRRNSAAVLADPNQWTDPYASYTKGRRALAGLDTEIRRRSDHRMTFQDVFRYLNDHEGPVTHGVLVDAVATTVDADLEEWLDKYVCGTDLPTVPDEEAAYGQGL